MDLPLSLFNVRTEIGGGKMQVWKSGIWCSYLPRGCLDQGVEEGLRNAFLGQDQAMGEERLGAEW